MSSGSERMIENQQAAFGRKLAKHFKMTQEEFFMYEPEFHESNEYGDGYYQFPDELPDGIAERIGAGTSKSIDVSAGELDEIENSEDPGVDDYGGPEDLRDHPKLPGLE